MARFFTILLHSTLAAGATAGSAPAAGATPGREINWYLSAGQIANNAALVRFHRASITGAYLCCGFGHVAANGSWSGVSQPTAAAQMAPFPNMSVWFVISVSNASIADANWGAGVASAAALAAQLPGLTGYIVDYEPVTNYTDAHAAAYAAFLKALCAALGGHGLLCGMDVADWTILGPRFWPHYVAAGVQRFTSMTPTYNAANVTADRAFVAQALAQLPAGRYEAGLGSTLGDAAACPMQYRWTEATFAPFVAWMGGAGVRSLAVWRCDIDKQYPAPDPTAPFVFGALEKYLAG